MTTQPTMSELTAQCLTEQEVRDFAVQPEEMPQGVYEVALEHLARCPECQQKLLAHQPAHVHEKQLVFS